MGLFKRLPLLKKTDSVIAFESWKVEWQSRDGMFFDNVHQEMEIFPDHDSAQEFAQSLREAFQHLRITKHGKVTVSKNELTGK
jgi:hypothetical protein